MAVRPRLQERHHFADGGYAGKNRYIELQHVVQKGRRHAGAHQELGTGAHCGVGLCGREDGAGAYQDVRDFAGDAFQRFEGAVCPQRELDDPHAAVGQCPGHGNCVLRVGDGDDGDDR